MKWFRICYLSFWFRICLLSLKELLVLDWICKIRLFVSSLVSEKWMLNNYSSLLLGEKERERKRKRKRERARGERKSQRKLDPRPPSLMYNDHRKKCSNQYHGSLCLEEEELCRQKHFLRRILRAQACSTARAEKIAYENHANCWIKFIMDCLSYAAAGPGSLIKLPFDCSSLCFSCIWHYQLSFISLDSRCFHISMTGLITKYSIKIAGV